MFIIIVFVPSVHVNDLFAVINNNYLQVKFHTQFHLGFHSGIYFGNFFGHIDANIIIAKYYFIEYNKDTYLKQWGNKYAYSLCRY